MRPEDALAAVSVNCERALRHGRMRKTFKGAVSVISQEEYNAYKMKRTGDVRMESDSEEEEEKGC